LLRTIYGDHGVAAGGQIERAGIEPGVSLDAFKRRVGFVAPHLQSSLAATTSLLARLRSSEPQQLTVDETVVSGLHASFGPGEPPSLVERRAARRALADFGLESLAARQLRELSYGQLRRVLFARAWINRPALLLLDEPFSGLDAATREDLKRELEALAARGATIVMATHHRHEWPRCATCELELRAGRVRYRGPVRHRGPVNHRASGTAAARGQFVRPWRSFHEPGYNNSEHKAPTVKGAGRKARGATVRPAAHGSETVKRHKAVAMKREPISRSARTASREHRQ